jgi:hypothetical protein
MAVQPLEDDDLVETDDLPTLEHPDFAALNLVDESNWRSLTQHEPIDLA